MGQIATTATTTDLHAVPATQTALPAVLPAQSLLQLIWLASPALPVGGFSYSEGLEAVISYAQAAPENIANDSEHEWISDWLRDQLK